MRPLVLILFFFSGASALLYQVVWARLLTHVFGTTATAVGVVLAAFMTGLALGAWLLGRMADGNHRPLRFYAALEIGIAATALAAHFALTNMTPVYLALYEWSGQSPAILAITRFVLAFALVTIPTSLMGGTLPVLARFLMRRLDAAGRDLSTAYAVNTAGAVAGVVASGFYLMAALGIHGTVYLAVGVNLALGAVAWIASLRATPVAAPSPTPAPQAGSGAEVSDATYRLLLMGLGISGLTSFAYEVYWTRSLVFVLGNSTYALTSVLTAFLTGIAIGGMVARQLVDRVRDRLALFGWVQIFIAVTAAAALPVLFHFVEPGAIRGYLRQASDDVAVLMLARFSIAMLVMLVPAVLIGMTFPVVARIGIVHLQATGARVGLVYASNTLGNVAGALLPGFVLLPWLGIQRGILLMAALNALVGLAVLAASRRRAPGLLWQAPVAALATAGVLVLVPVDFRFPTEGEGPDHRVLYYRDGPSATTKVTLDPDTGAKVMAIDGIVIGGNTFTEYKQLLLAHLPKLLLDDHSTELSVGLGSGMLAGESIRHDGVERLTAVEIEPSVVAGARLFRRENGNVLSDPRVEVVMDDIGNHLRTTTRRYRVISADEKTALEYASNGFSYSREYYELLRRRLAPGGMAIQWVPANLPPSQYRMVLKTFSESFPHVLMALFMPALEESGYNTILMGSDAALSLDIRQVRKAMAAQPAAFSRLAHYGLTTPESILAQFVADGDTLRRAVRHAPENTLAHPRYEFFSPRDYAQPRKGRVAENIELAARLRGSAWAHLAARMAPPDDKSRRRLGRAAAAELAFLAGYRKSLDSGTVSATDIFRHYDAALAFAPWNHSLRARISRHYAEIAASQRAPRARLALLRRALSAYEKNAAAQVDYARVLARLKQPRAALEAARRAVELDPELPAARRTLADLLLAAGETAAAAPHLRAMTELLEGDPAP